MKKGKFVLALFGLLTILVMPFSTGIAAAQEQTGLPPTQPMPVPAPGIGGIYGTSTSDTSPAQTLILPEVIWAAASGGGTWATRLQITALESGTVVRANFFFGTSQTTYYTIFTSTGVNQSVTFANILNTLGTLKGVSLYGQVGTLALITGDPAHHIIADVETMNGDYGKSFPGLQYTDNTTLNVDRAGMIQDISNNSTWRTGVGCWNGSSYSVTVTFYVIGSSWVTAGNPFQYTLAPWQFVSFNPFTQAGLSGYALDGYRLFAFVNSTEGPSPYSLGLCLYGSKANNLTNDSCALLCKQYHM